MRCNHIWRAISDRQYQCRKCGETCSTPDPKDAEIERLRKRVTELEWERDGLAQQLTEREEEFEQFKKWANDAIRKRVAELEGALKEMSGHFSRRDKRATQLEERVAELEGLLGTLYATVRGEIHWKTRRSLLSMMEGGMNRSEEE